jgi:hypothetical protein
MMKIWWGTKAVSMADGERRGGITTWQRSGGLGFDHLIRAILADLPSGRDLQINSRFIVLR